MQELVPSDSREPLVDAPGENPIPLQLCVGLRNRRMAAERKSDLYEFLNWCLGEEQDLIPGQGYDRLPSAVAGKARSGSRPSCGSGISFSRRSVS